ncbi:hypothetical protein BX261_4615 [Streptomyces sp. 2321.6]|nr:hypothetical protein BX261_4615 [Streptomyces sp. 2321.6]
MPRRTLKEAEEARDYVIKSKGTVLRRHFREGDSVSKLAREYGVSRFFLAGLIDSWGVQRRGKHKRS